MSPCPLDRNPVDWQWFRRGQPAQAQGWHSSLSQCKARHRLLRAFRAATTMGASEEFPWPGAGQTKAVLRDTGD